jgi:hypothetical protein
MLTANLNTQIRLFESFPRQVQVAIVAYANAAKLPPATVIEFVLTHFLELDPRTIGELQSTIEEDSILAELPAFLQVGIAQYAIENEMPPEFVVELAIAHFLDSDSVTFDDCQVGVQRDRVELLKLHRGTEQVRAA